MAFRVDIGELGKAEETPQGGMKVPALLTRTGIFEYTTDDGKTIREYRPPEEVFKVDSMRSLNDAPLCNTHPTDHVNPDNFKRLSVGHVGNDVKKADDKLASYVVVQDARTIEDIRDGRRELSCGYHCDVDETPGVLPDGSRYDRVQRNIRYNHLALVDNGRAGRDVRLRLDSAGNQRRNDEMKIEVIEGTEYEVGSAAHGAAVKRRDEADSARAAEVAALKKRADEQQARADNAAAKLKKADSFIKTSLSQKRLDHAVAVRTVVVKKARGFLGGEFKADGLSNTEIKAAAIKKVLPKVRLDGKAKGFIDGLFRGLIEAKRLSEVSAPSRKDSYSRIPPELRSAPTGTEVSTPEQARARRLDEEEMRHRKPLAISKSNPHREMDGYPTVQGSMLETMK